VSKFNFWRTFTGRSARVEQRGVRAQMADLERRTGSTAAAARAAGVSRGTWWRIKTGRTRAPRAGTAQRIKGAHRGELSSPGRRMLVGAATSPRARVTGYGPRYVGDYNVNGYARHAPFHFYSAAALDHLRGAQGAWLAGNDEAAHAAVAAAMSAEIGYPTTPEGGDVEWT
jgi:hypothetical protein